MKKYLFLLCGLFIAGSIIAAPVSYAHHGGHGGYCGNYDGHYGYHNGNCPYNNSDDCPYYERNRQ